MPQEDDLPAEHNLAFPGSELTERRWTEPSGTRRNIHGDSRGSDAGTAENTFEFNELNRPELTNWYQKELEARDWFVKVSDAEPDQYPALVIEGIRKTDDWRFSVTIRHLSPDEYVTLWYVRPSEPLPKEDDLPTEHNLAFPGSELTDRQWGEPFERTHTFVGESLGPSVGLVVLTYKFDRLDSTELTNWYQKEIEERDWAVTEFVNAEDQYPRELLLATRSTEFHEYQMTLLQLSPDEYEAGWSVKRIR